MAFLRWAACAGIALWSTTARADHPLTPLPDPIDFTGFAGAGFDANPAAGQLDSDDWSVVGLSDGVLDFGGTQDSGDFARGQSFGGVSEGGLYAWDTGGGNIAFGGQPTSNDLTSGAFTLRLRNDTGQEVNAVTVRCDIWVSNDGGRSSLINLSYSVDGVMFSVADSVSLVTPEAADDSGWHSGELELAIDELALADGDNLYLRWRMADESGGGARDEFGIDDIEFEVHGICGNGVGELSEECDDGNDDNTDDCVAGCVDAVCGDGFVHAGTEECDDGNRDDADACRNDCTVGSAADTGEATDTSPPETTTDGTDTANATDATATGGDSATGSATVTASGTSPTTVGGDTGNGDDETGEAPFAGEEAPGCGCRTQKRASPLWVALLFLVAGRRCRRLSRR